MREGRRRLLSLLLRGAVTAGLLGWLLAKSDLPALASHVRGLSLSTWLLAASMYLGAQVLSSLRWWILSRSLGFPGTWPQYCALYFVGMYFNLFLPTSVGGDVWKAYRLTRDAEGAFLATSTVLGDRFLGLAAMAMLGAMAAGISPGVLPRPFVLILLFGGTGLLLSLLALPLLGKGFLRFRGRTYQRMARVLAAWMRPGVLLPVAALSLALQILGMGAVTLLALGIEIPLPFVFFLATLPLIAVLTLLPVSLGGIGVREGAFVYFLALEGVPAEKALSLSLLFFSIQAGWSLLGGLGYLAGLHRRPLKGPSPGVPATTAQGGPL